VKIKVIKTEQKLLVIQTWYSFKHSRDYRHRF